MAEEFGVELQANVGGAVPAADRAVVRVPQQPAQAGRVGARVPLRLGHRLCPRSAPLRLPRPFHQQRGAPQRPPHDVLSLSLSRSLSVCSVCASCCHVCECVWIVDVCLLQQLRSAGVPDVHTLVLHARPVQVRLFLFIIIVVIVVVCSADSTGGRLTTVYSSYALFLFVCVAFHRWRKRNGLA